MSDNSDPNSQEHMGLPVQNKTYASVVADGYNNPSDGITSAVVADTLTRDKEGLLIAPTNNIVNLLQHLGRGIIIKGLPKGLKLSEICANIKGETLERIDFKENENRTVVGAYFCKPQDALEFVNYTTQNGGIYWEKSSKWRSMVELISANRGGAEPIRGNVARGITSESATRCLMIENLPVSVASHRLMKDISNQSRNVLTVFETCKVDTVSSGGRRSNRVVIRMASIGTALGAKQEVYKTRFYSGARIRFLPDPCNNCPHELAPKWSSAEEVDNLKRHTQARNEMNKQSTNVAGDVEKILEESSLDETADRPKLLEL